MSLVAIAQPGALPAQAIRPGDLLVRAAPADGVRYSAIVVSARPEARAELLSRGVPVEAGGGGWYVEVAETTSSGGQSRSVGRRLTDAWGRVPRGQMVLRSSETGRGEVAAESELAEDDPKKAFQLKVVTWNIQVTNSSSVTEVGDAILTMKPDIVALQEVGVDWPDVKKAAAKVDMPRVLAKHVGLPFHLFAGALFKGGGRFGVALLSRWKFTSLDTTNLPRKNSTKDEQRVLVRARVDAPIPFTLLNTHLARVSSERPDQATVVGAAAAAAETPVVLCGGFNDEPTSKTFTSIRGTLIDCLAATGPKDGRTFEVGALKESIDYILCGGGFEPLGPTQVVTSVTKSDHHPVTAIVGPAKSPTTTPSSSPTSKPTSGPTTRPTGEFPLWREKPWFRGGNISPPPPVSAVYHIEPIRAIRAE